LSTGKHLAGKYIFIGQQSLTFRKIGSSGPLPILQIVHKSTKLKDEVKNKPKKCTN